MIAVRACICVRFIENVLLPLESRWTPLPLLAVWAAIVTACVVCFWLDLSHSIHGRLTLHIVRENFETQHTIKHFAVSLLRRKKAAAAGSIVLCIFVLTLLTSACFVLLTPLSIGAHIYKFANVRLCILPFWICLVSPLFRVLFFAHSRHYYCTFFALFRRSNVCIDVIANFVYRRVWL